MSLLTIMHSRPHETRIVVTDDPPVLMKKHVPDSTSQQVVHYIACHAYFHITSICNVDGETFLFPWQWSKCSLDVVLKEYSGFNTSEAQSIALGAQCYYYKNIFLQFWTGLTMEVNGPKFGGFKSRNVNHIILEKHLN